MLRFRHSPTPTIRFPHTSSGGSRTSSFGCRMSCYANSYSSNGAEDARGPWFARMISLMLTRFLLPAAMAAFVSLTGWPGAVEAAECYGYTGPGGACYTGPGGGLYTGPGGGAYTGPGGGLYTGPGGGLYTGPGGGAYTGPGGGLYTGPGGGAYTGPGRGAYTAP